MPLPNPVVFVPGVTATDLRDLYSLPPKTVWSLMTKDYERVGLHPEDHRYEAALPAQVRADQVFEIAYKEMVLDLRHDLTEKADRPVPVYVFGYDWRQPLEITQNELAAFIQEVIEKTALTRHYHADGYGRRKRVNLLGHSMGGLVITGYLAGAQGAAPVDRVATIATPFRGSLEAVEKIAIGSANRREREAARLTPALYYLLPSFKRGITIADTLPQSDIFNPKLWQRSVVDTIQESLRLRGSGATADTVENADKILRKTLASAKAHRKTVESFSPALCGLAPADWLCAIGIGDKTRVGMWVTDSPAGPFFDLGRPDLVGSEPTPTWRTGDGTVPYEGALPPFEAKTKVFSRKDFGFFEIRDKLLDSLTALHGILPNMNKLQGELRDHFFFSR